MAITRYSNIAMIDFDFFGTTGGYVDIKNALDSGAIEVDEYVVRPGDRLDTLAYNFFGDGKYWWIIAIANDIGWGLQIASGRTLRIPKSVTQIIDRI